jgi:hypothetical protein
MYPVHRLRKALVGMNAVTAMIITEDIVSKEFPEFLETIQKEGT